MPPSPDGSTHTFWASRTETRHAASLPKSVSALVFQRDRHVVDVNVVRSAVAVKVDLKCVGELQAVSRKQGIVCEVDGRGDAVDGDGVMNDLGSRCVIHGDDVVPGIGSKA